MNRNSITAAAWTVWIIASIFYAYQYILRVMPNIMLNDITDQFHLNPGEFGQFSGVYYIGYALMQIPLGIMLDRFGPRKVMTGCILLTVIGLMPLIFAENWTYPIMGRLLIGIGSSAAILGVFKIVRMTFTESQFSRMVSFSVMIGVIGAIWGGGPVSMLRDIFGYHIVIQGFALLGILLALITYLIVPEQKNTATISAAEGIKEVLTNKRVILCSLFAGFMVGPMEGFADGWATLFLTVNYGYESAYAASIPSMIFIGMCFGGPLLSFIGDRIGHLLTIFLAGTLMAGAFVFLLLTKMPVEASVISFTVIGVCSAYQILAIYKASTFVSENAAGLTTAIVNMIIMIFGYAFHSLIGSTVNYMGGKAVPLAINMGVWVVPIGLALGALGFFILFASEKKQTIAETL